nr:MULTISPECIES: D-2-hydroxyacid dehydrogenase [unclassified Streptomyces]
MLDLLAGVARVRWVHTRATGVDPRVLAEVQRCGAVFTCGRGGHGQAVAEHVVALVLAHLRRIPELIGRQTRREWDDSFGVDTLHGRLVGVLGAGDLGGTTAVLMEAFGAQLRILRRSGVRADRMYGPEELDQFLSGLEVLVVALPLTRETAGMLSADRLARVASGCLLVNVGRGAVVDQDAMISALRSGQLGGAALDVFVEEPLPTSSPLWSLPGVIVSPHCADATPTADARMLDVYLAQLARFRTGLPLSNVVSPELGY